MKPPEWLSGPNGVALASPVTHYSVAQAEPVPSVARLPWESVQYLNICRLLRQVAGHGFGSAHRSLDPGATGWRCSPPPNQPQKEPLWARGASWAHC